MGVSFCFGWEPACMTWLQHAMGSLALPVGTIFTLFGEQYVIILVLAFMYICYDKKIGKKIAMMMMAGLISNGLIKNIFCRRRPYLDHPEITCLRAPETGADPFDVAAQGYSFPSGHATNSMIAFGSLAYYYPRRIMIVLAVVLPFLIGLSRCLLGVHYPTDVMAGWAVGLIIIFGLGYLQEKLPNWVLSLALLVFAVVGLFYCHTADYFTSVGVLIGFYAGTFFDEKFVRFKVTHDPLQGALRMACIFAVFFVLNPLLKLPFDPEWLEEAGALQFMIRVIRYALIVFILIGVFPITFKYMEKIPFLKRKSASGKNE